MAHPTSGPKRRGRVVPPSTPVDDPVEFARLNRLVDGVERPTRPVHSRHPGVRAIPAMAGPPDLSGLIDPFHPPVRSHLAALEKCLRHVERTTYQRMSTVFDDWVDLTNITLDTLPGHLREAIETGRLSDWPANTPPDQIAAFERIRLRYGAKATEAFTGFSHAFAEFLEATHDHWFDWMGQLYMHLELGGRGVGDYYTPWSVAYMMAEIQDIQSLLKTRMQEALTHEDNALGAAVGLTGLLFQPGPVGEAPVLADGELNDYFTRWVIPAAAPFFDPITVADIACGSGVMLLAAASTVPLWARRYGFVQFFGQDIMRIAVQMCRAQMCAYGLNGFEARMVQTIEDAGWDTFQQRQRAHAAAHPATAPTAPSITVVPRHVTGHIGQPTLSRRPAPPTIHLHQPTAEESVRMLAHRPPRKAS